MSIFDLRAAKRGKNSWRETNAPLVQNSEVPKWHHALCRVPPRHFETLHQWRIVSFQDFYPVWPPYSRKFRFGTFDPKTGKSWRKFTRHQCKVWKCRGGTLHSAECLSDTSEFAPGVRKVSLQDFSPFWPPYGRKFQIGTFDQGATRTYVRYFRSWCDQKRFQKACDQWKAKKNGHYNRRCETLRCIFPAVSISIFANFTSQGEQ